MNVFQQNLNFTDIQIYTIDDIRRILIRHYPQNKVRYNKIYEELENVDSIEFDNEKYFTKKNLQKYMKRKMLCFYNPKIAAEIFNLMQFDKFFEKTVNRRYFSKIQHIIIIF